MTQNPRNSIERFDSHFGLWICGLRRTGYKMLNAFDKRTGVFFILGKSVWDVVRVKRNFAGQDV